MYLKLSNSDVSIYNNTFIHIIDFEHVSAWNSYQVLYMGMFFVGCESTRKPGIQAGRVNRCQKFNDFGSSLYTNGITCRPKPKVVEFLAEHFFKRLSQKFSY